MEVSLDIEIVTMKKGISMNDETHGVRCVSQGGVPGPDPPPSVSGLHFISSHKGSSFGGYNLSKHKLSTFAFASKQ